VNPDDDLFFDPGFEPPLDGNDGDGNGDMSSELVIPLETFDPGLDPVPGFELFLDSDLDFIL
jgi:hypothetical protein